MNHAKVACCSVGAFDTQLLCVAVAFTLLPTCTVKRVKHIPPPTREGAPRSRAVWVGDTLYLAGDGAPHEEAHQLMRSAQATLE